MHRGHPKKCRSPGDACRRHPNKDRSVPNFYPGHPDRDRSRPTERRSGPRRDGGCSNEHRGRPDERRPDRREHGVIPNEIRIPSTQTGPQSKDVGVRSEDIGALRKIIGGQPKRIGGQPKRIGLVAKNVGARQRRAGLAKEDRSLRKGNRIVRIFVGVTRNFIGGILSAATPSTPARGISNIRPGLTRRDRAASRMQWAPHSRRPGFDPTTTGNNGSRSGRGQRSVPRPRQPVAHRRPFPRRACKREACRNPRINLPIKAVAGIFFYARGDGFRVVATCQPNPRGRDEAEASSWLPLSASKCHRALGWHRRAARIGGRACEFPISRKKKESQRGRRRPPGSRSLENSSIRPSYRCSL